MYEKRARKMRLWLFRRLNKAIDRWKHRVARINIYLRWREMDDVKSPDRLKLKVTKSE